MRSNGSGRDTKKKASPRDKRKAPSLPRPFFLISQINHEILRRLNRGMRSSGITPAVGRVLNAIATRPHISSSQLARMFGISPQSVKQSIQLLEDRDLIVRTASSEDQRVLGAELTEAGWIARDKQRDAIDAMYQDVFDVLETDEMDELARLLTKVLLKARPTSLEYYSALAKDVSAAKAHKDRNK